MDTNKTIQPTYYNPAETKTQYLGQMKNCKCGVELIIGNNVHKSMFNNKDYRCKSCFNKHSTKVSIERGYYKKIDNKWNPGVYGIFENGECLYVGESIQPYKRLNNHKSAITNINPTNYHKHLYEQLSQHTHLILGIIEETGNHKEREGYWINKLNPKYNVSNTI